MTLSPERKNGYYGDVAIDMIAGPSEICVVADESAPADYVAADLLSQAEHDEAATSICITTSEELAEKISKEVEQQLIRIERVKRLLGHPSKIMEKLLSQKT